MYVAVLLLVKNVWLPCFLLLNTQAWHYECMYMINDEMLVWLSASSEVQSVCIWFIHPSQKPVISCLFYIQTGFPFWYRLTQVVLEKRLLNGCSVVVVVVVAV